MRHVGEMIGVGSTQKRHSRLPVRTTKRTDGREEGRCRSGLAFGACTASPVASPQAGDPVLRYQSMVEAEHDHRQTAPLGSR
jgi:hypothetical protein